MKTCILSSVFDSNTIIRKNLFSKFEYFGKEIVLHHVLSLSCPFINFFLVSFYFFYFFFFPLKLSHQLAADINPSTVVEFSLSPVQPLRLPIIIESDSLFRRQVIATWSSGTGGAGIIGALSYASLTTWLSNEDTLLLMLIVPIIQGITFWLVLVHPPQSSIPITKNGIDSQEQIIEIPRKSFKEKINLVPGLLKYMIPLGLVYLFEYFINQGLVMLFCYTSFFVELCLFCPPLSSTLLLPLLLSYCVSHFFFFYYYFLSFFFFLFFFFLYILPFFI